MSLTINPLKKHYSLLGLTYSFFKCPLMIANRWWPFLTGMSRHIWVWCLMIAWSQQQWFREPHARSETLTRNAQTEPAWQSLIRKGPYKLGLTPHKASMGHGGLPTPVTGKKPLTTCVSESAPPNKHSLEVLPEVFFHLFLQAGSHYLSERLLLPQFSRTI